eukprot:5769111-Pyramimonas_sp.AAC.1
MMPVLSADCGQPLRATSGCAERQSVLTLKSARRGIPPVPRRNPRGSRSHAVSTSLNITVWP